MSVVLSEHLPLLASAPDGIQKLRGLILELAVRGKLVPQDPNDEPASEMLKRISHERVRLEEGTTRKKNGATPLDDAEMLFKLPESWAWERLGNTVEVLDSLRKPVTKSDRKPGPYPYYGASGVVDYVSDFLFDEDLVLVGEDGAKWGAGDRTAFSISGKTWVNNHAHVLRPNRQVLIDSYLVHALVARDLQQYITGITVPKLNQAKLVSIEIPVPPVAEQHRIVTKVDELMVLCDRLEAEQTDAEAAHAKLVETLLGTLTQSTDATDLATNWQRLAEHFDTLFTTEPSLDALKQTILQLAVMGKLVPQDPNDEPASATLAKGHTGHACDQSHDADVAPFAIPPRWRWEKLQQLLEPERDISYGVIKLGIEPKTGGVWTLRCSDVKPGMINLFGVRKVSDEIERNYIRTRLTGGEILLNIRGTLGGVALVPSELAGYNVAREVAVIPVHKGISGKYLVDVMLSDYFWKSILNGLRGIAYKGLNLGTLRTFLIPLPPLTEQHRIVAKVDELMALCDRLKADLIESRSRQERLAVTLIESALEAA